VGWRAAEGGLEIQSLNWSLTAVGLLAEGSGGEDFED